MVQEKLKSYEELLVLECQAVRSKNKNVININRKKTRKFLISKLV